MEPRESDASVVQPIPAMDSQSEISSLTLSNSPGSKSKFDFSSDSSNSVQTQEECIASGTCSSTTLEQLPLLSASSDESMNDSIQAISKSLKEAPMTTSPTARKSPVDTSLMVPQLTRTPSELDRYIEELDAEQVSKYDTKCEVAVDFHIRTP